MPDQSTQKFEGWVRSVFESGVVSNLSPEVSAEYVTRLFQNIDVLGKPYTEVQIKQGLWFLIDMSCSNYMHDALSEKVPWQKRELCLRSILNVYEKLFLPRCTTVFQGAEQAESNPLNEICYMWWDLMPVFGVPDDPAHTRLDALILDILEQCLSIKSMACRESALHGLGHWQHYYPTRVMTIIDAFLTKYSGISPELKVYALEAKQGRVL